MIQGPECFFLFFPLKWPIPFSAMLSLKKTFPIYMVTNHQFNAKREMLCFLVLSLKRGIFCTPFAFVFFDFYIENGTL